MQYVIKTWGQRMLRLLFPPECLSCGKQITKARLLCFSCFAQVQQITKQSCQICAVPLVSAGEALADGMCYACRGAKLDHVWHEARAAFVYDDVSRAIILALKYGGRMENAIFLASHMARSGGTIWSNADLIVPVPLHLSRLRQRGYNQSALLAKALSVKVGLGWCVDALVRSHATQSLGGRSVLERQRILQGVIGVSTRRTHLLSGQHIVVVDDVMTTGATLSVCAKALLKVGVRKISVVVAAKVLSFHHDDSTQTYASNH